jgi:hypothetical protein
MPSAAPPDETAAPSPAGRGPPRRLSGRRPGSVRPQRLPRPEPTTTVAEAAALITTMSTAGEDEPAVRFERARARSAEQPRRSKTCGPPRAPAAHSRTSSLACVCTPTRGPTKSGGRARGLLEHPPSFGRAKMVVIQSRFAPTQRAVHAFQAQRKELSRPASTCDSTNHLSPPFRSQYDGFLSLLYVLDSARAVPGGVNPGTGVCGGMDSARWLASDTDPASTLPIAPYVTTSRESVDALIGLRRPTINGRCRWSACPPCDSDRGRTSCCSAPGGGIS